MSKGTPLKPSKTGSEFSLHSVTSIHDAVYMRDLARGDIESLINNCVLLTVDDFLEEMMLPITDPPDIPKVAEDIFKDVTFNQGSKHTLEKNMYEPLQKGFNYIADEVSKKLKVHSIRCIQTYTKMNAMAEEQGFDANIAPDLYLTFHEKEIGSLFNTAQKSKTSLFHYPGLIIEVKRSDGAGFPWVHGKDDTYGTPLTNDAKDLLEQVHRYIAYAQYPAYPYRFIYCITITGQYMRFWKWAATGARVSDRIKYRENSSPVVKFVQALHMGQALNKGESPDMVQDLAIGVNVGKGLLFKPYMGLKETEINKRVEKIATEYQKAASPAWSG